MSFSTPHFGQESIAMHVLDKVNTLRDSLDLGSLKYDETLSKAAKDQAYYMANKNKLTHFQKTFTKETVSERVIYYKGNRTYVGENVALNKEKLSDANHIAESLFKSWRNSPAHYKNLIHPDYTKMGLAYSVSKKKKLYAAQVFSSNEIKLPKEFKNEDISWGVRPAEFTCKDEESTYQTMFFANNIQIVGNSIYFYSHDRKFFENVISSDNDGLAIDIILREQLPCEKENQFHISAVHDGEMQRPIYKNDLYRNNESNNPKKIRVKIGEIPSYLRDQQWEPNIIIINDNKLCDYSYPMYVPQNIFPLLALQPYYDMNDNIDTNSNKWVSVEVKDSIHVELMYHRSEKSFSSLNTEEFNRMLGWSPFIKKVNVDCFASVEGATWFNQQLLDDRKENVSKLLTNNAFDINRVKIQTQENWEAMRSQINQNSITPLKNKTESQIKHYLKKNKSAFLDSLLFDQRKTHIRANIDTTIEIDSYDEWLFACYYDTTLSINSLPWNKILREDYILSNRKIEAYLIDSLKSRNELKTNLLGAASIKNSPAFMDSLLVKEFMDTVDANNSKQVFNYAHFLTKYWFSKYSRTYETKGTAKSIPPNNLRKMVSKLDTNEIAQDDIIRLNVNILLSGIHYYVTHNKWSLVNEYFDEIAQFVQLGNFTPQEAMELALFCNHFYKFKVAVDILEPFHEKVLLTEEGYFVLAQTSTLIRNTLQQEDYWTYMESAKKANHSRYCMWLNESFQIQRDEYIKDDFCKECQ